MFLTYTDVKHVYRDFIGLCFLGFVARQPAENPGKSLHPLKT